MTYQLSTSATVAQQSHLTKVRKNTTHLHWQEHLNCAYRYSKQPWWSVCEDRCVDELICSITNVSFTPDSLHPVKWNTKFLLLYKDTKISDILFERVHWVNGIQYFRHNSESNFCFITSWFVLCSTTIMSWEDYHILWMNLVLNPDVYADIRI